PIMSSTKPNGLLDDSSANGELEVALIQPGSSKQQKGPNTRAVSTSASVPENLQSSQQSNNAGVNDNNRPSKCRSLGSLKSTGVSSLLPGFDRLDGVSAGLSWMLPRLCSPSVGKANPPAAKARTNLLRNSTNDNLIDQFDRIYSEIVMDDGKFQVTIDSRATVRSIRLAQLSFFVNLSLAIIKAVAIGLSGSLSVISSLIDSLIDLVSGVVVWITNHQVKNRNPYYYPQGKTRLEPVSIVILAVIMSTSTVQIIIKALESIITMATASRAVVLSFNASRIIDSCCVWCSGSENISTMHYFGNDKEPEVFSYYVFYLIGSVIAIKLTLYLLCSRLGTTSSTEALAQDHRNDCISNSSVLIMTVLSRYLWPYCDAIGALGISIYIIYTWVQTLKEQVRLLTGYTANPDFLKQLTYICLNHHPLVLEIDTVRAFHIGNNFLVEVDIVLPETLTLRESHDIGESLQCKLEKLEAVERAFVHLDYESSHHPHSEHKQV
uniref:ZT_dimer domain-containing protein n=1 Tax=Macrostomum lignano TaxID=282301 RepID=A0A1I8GQZ3_9PLAT